MRLHLFKLIADLSLVEKGLLRRILEKEKVRSIIVRLTQRGYQITPEALNILMSDNNEREVENILKEIFEKTEDKWITKEVLREILDKKKKRHISGEAYVSEINPRIAMESRIEILKDPSKFIDKGISIDYFRKLFLDRFHKLEKIIKIRNDWNTVTSIENALEAKQGDEVKVIGLVFDKKITKNSIKIVLEDEESTIEVFIPVNNDPELREKAEKVLLDQVIGVEGIKGRSDFIIGKNIVFPDIPMRKTRKSTEEVYVALISDLHIGSKLFLERSFEKFIKWIKGEIASGGQARIVERLKYIVVAGDIVDGIGVYPKQEEDLDIEDVYEQYQIASKIFEQIPSCIEIIVSPGNHDATSKALPQPPISREYMGRLYDMDNIHIVGNPVWLRLHGVELLLCHGRVLDSVISSVPGLTPSRVEEAMEILLKGRHLAPIYGKNALIAPAHEDTLVIDRVPDIFHSGHVHVERQKYYRGTLIVNSGTWQAQTNYQRLNNVTPTPAIIPIVSLNDLGIHLFNFRV